MLNTTDKIIKHKTGLLNLAEELGNVSKACQVIPEQLVTGATARSWEHLISSDLVPRVGHELRRILSK